MESVDQVGGFVKVRPAGTKHGECRAFSRCLYLGDRCASELERGAGDSVDRSANRTLNPSYSNPDPQSESVQAPAKIQNQAGNPVKTGCHGLKFIAGGDCIGDSNEVVIHLRNARSPEFLVQSGTQTGPRAGPYNVRDEN